MVSYLLIMVYLFPAVRNFASVMLTFATEKCLSYFWKVRHFCLELLYNCDSYDDFVVYVVLPIIIFAFFYSFIAQVLKIKLPPDYQINLNITAYASRVRNVPILSYSLSRP